MNDNAKEIARLKGIITKLVQAGAGCSNVCFNLSQLRGHVITHTECTSMREAARVWDEATKHART